MLTDEKTKFLLNIAELVYRFEDTVEIFNNSIKENFNEANEQEISFLSTATFNIKNSKHANLRQIIAKEKNEKDSQNLAYIQEYRKLLEEDYFKTLLGFNNTLSQLLTRTEDPKRKISYLLSMTRNNNSICEYAKNELKEKVSNETLQYYNIALQEANKLSPLNYMYLSIILDQSKFFYEVLGQKSKAIEIVKEIIKKYEEEMVKLGKSDEIKDATSIIDLLKDILDMWMQED